MGERKRQAIWRLLEAVKIARKRTVEPGRDRCRGGALQKKTVLKSKRIEVFCHEEKI